MSDERWRRIEEVFHHAAELAPIARAEYLSGACVGDDVLRQQVESLLANDNSGNHILSAAVAQAFDQLPGSCSEQQTPLSAGTRLGPYEILARLGAGGMGEVWKAHDTRLDRVVAIKRLKDSHGHRFEQEARAIAALNHPNICQIHDVGPDYLVLEHIDGKPLEGPLPVDQAMRLALQMCEALTEAHRLGIIHRDLKPANILVTQGGSAKLLDFGLAKLRDGPNADVTQTAEGTMIGTAAYMSPEQASGKPLDERSDVFSFGAVLYEMVSGKRAFGGSSTAEVLSAVLRDDPQPLKAPPALNLVVMRCLRKRVAERFQTMADVKADLESLAEKGFEGQASVAVLPFANMSRELDDEYFADGLSEELINALTQVPNLKVIARTSAFAFKGKNEDIRKIAETLGVSHVLEGSVRRAGNRLRVTAQLIHAADGMHLWSQRYDRQTADIFAIQDEISAAIVGQLKVNFADAMPVKKRSTSVAAYEAFLEGEHHFYRVTPKEILKAVECYQRALTVDPGYALASASIALSYGVMVHLGTAEPRPLLLKGRVAAEHALELDPQLAEAHAQIGFFRALLDYDWEGAERHFRRAFELTPASLHVRGPYLISCLLALGRSEEAVLECDHVLEVDPLSFSYRTAKAGHLMYSRHYERAAAEATRVLDIHPTGLLASRTLAWVRALQGRFDDASSLVQRAIESFGGLPQDLSQMGAISAMAGRSEEARRVLDQLLELRQRIYVCPGEIALIYSHLGELDVAFEWAERAIEQRDASVLILKTNPIWDPLRADPRFPSLLRKMNLG